MIPKWLSNFVKEETITRFASLLSVKWEDENKPAWEGSLEDFLKDNSDLSPNDMESLTSLELGDSMNLGGGAAPMATITRVAALKPTAQSPAPTLNYQIWLKTGSEERPASVITSDKVSLEGILNSFKRQKHDAYIKEAVVHYKYRDFVVENDGKGWKANLPGQEGNLIAGTEEEVKSEVDSFLKREGVGSGKEFLKKTPKKGADESVLHSIKWTRKPVEWADVKLVKLTPEQSEAVQKLEIVEDEDDQIVRPTDDFTSATPGQFFVVKNSHGTYVVNTEGFDYARYVIKLAYKKDARDFQEAAKFYRWLDQKKDITRKEYEALSENEQDELDDEFDDALSKFENPKRAALEMFTVETAQGVLDQLRSGLKVEHFSGHASTLGGAENVSILFGISLDKKETWANQIYENSRHTKYHLYNDGTLEDIAGWGMERFRKRKFKDVETLISKLNEMYANASSKADWEKARAESRGAAQKNADHLDELDRRVSHANKKAHEVAKALQAAGVKVLKVEEGDTDADPLIDLGKGLHVQVSALMGTYLLGRWDDKEETLYHLGEFKDVPGLLEGIKNPKESSKMASNKKAGDEDDAEYQSHTKEVRLDLGNNYTDDHLAAKLAEDENFVSWLWELPIGDDVELIVTHNFSNMVGKDKHTFAVNDLADMVKHHVKKESRATAKKHVSGDSIDALFEKNKMKPGAVDELARWLALDPDGVDLQVIRHELHTVGVDEEDAGDVYDIFQDAGVPLKFETRRAADESPNLESPEHIAESYINGNIGYVKKQIGSSLKLFVDVKKSLKEMGLSSDELERFEYVISQSTFYGKDSSLSRSAKSKLHVDYAGGQFEAYWDDIDTGKKVYLKKHDLSSIKEWANRMGFDLVMTDEAKEFSKDSSLSKAAKWVSVYKVIRQYGGPEEGGWWYNTSELIESHEMKDGDVDGVDALIQELEKKFPYDPKELSSVEGQGTHEVIVEDSRGESEDLRVQRYSSLNKKAEGDKSLDRLKKYFIDHLDTLTLQQDPKGQIANAILKATTMGEVLHEARYGTNESRLVVLGDFFKSSSLNKKADTMSNDEKAQIVKDIKDWAAKNSQGDPVMAMPGEEGKKYSQYASPNSVYISFDSNDLYDYLNDPSEANNLAMGEKFRSFLKSKGLWYEQGNAWNANIYKSSSLKAGAAGWQTLNKKADTMPKFQVEVDLGESVDQESELFDHLVTVIQDSIDHSGNVEYSSYEDSGPEAMIFEVHSNEKNEDELETHILNRIGRNVEAGKSEQQKIDNEMKRILSKVTLHIKLRKSSSLSKQAEGDKSLDRLKKYFIDQLDADDPKEHQQTADAILKATTMGEVLHEAGYGGSNELRLVTLGDFFKKASLNKKADPQAPVSTTPIEYRELGLRPKEVSPERMERAESPTQEIQNAYDRLQESLSRIAAIKRTIDSARQEFEKQVVKIKEQGKQVEAEQDVRDYTDKVASLLEATSQRMSDMGASLLAMRDVAKTVGFKPTDSWRLKKLLERFEGAQEYLDRAEKGAHAMDTEEIIQEVVQFPKPKKLSAMDVLGSNFMDMAQDVYESLKGLLKDTLTLEDELATMVTAEAKQASSQPWMKRVEDIYQKNKGRFSSFKSSREFADAVWNRHNDWMHGEEDLESKYGDTDEFLNARAKSSDFEEALLANMSDDVMEAKQAKSSKLEKVVTEVKQNWIASVLENSETSWRDFMEDYSKLSESEQDAIDKWWGVATGNVAKAMMNTPLVLKQAKKSEEFPNDCCDQWVKDVEKLERENDDMTRSDAQGIVDLEHEKLHGKKQWAKKAAGPFLENINQLLKEPEDMQWLRDTHLKGLDVPNFNSAGISGNEDAPDVIVLFENKSPDIFDVPIAVYKMDDDGKYQKQASLKSKMFCRSCGLELKECKKAKDQGGPCCKDCHHPSYESVYKPKETPKKANSMKCPKCGKPTVGPVGPTEGVDRFQWTCEDGHTWKTDLSDLEYGDEELGREIQQEQDERRKEGKSKVLFALDELYVGPEGEDDRRYGPYSTKELAQEKSKELTNSYGADKKYYSHEIVQVKQGERRKEGKTGFKVGDRVTAGDSVGTVTHVSADGVSVDWDGGKNPEVLPTDRLKLKDANRGSDIDWDSEKPPMALHSLVQPLVDDMWAELRSGKPGKYHEMAKPPMALHALGQSLVDVIWEKLRAL